MHSLGRLRSFTFLLYTTPLIHILTSPKARTFWRIWQWVTTNSMNIKANAVPRPFNSPTNFPQKSYILISTNLFFEYGKKWAWASVYRFASAKFRFVLQCVWSPWLRLERDFRLSALASLPLGLFMLSFMGSINIRTEKMNWVNPFQVLSLYILKYNMALGSDYYVVSKFFETRQRCLCCWPSIVLPIRMN
jgi:hypothetical protein